MEGESDPLERAYEPPGETAGPSAAQREPPFPDFRLVRLHLLVLAVAMVIFAAVTAGMQLELWDPAPTTLTAVAYNLSFTIHGTAVFTMLLPVYAGVLPMLVLPGTGMRFPSWVAWPALVMWGATVVPWWAWIDPLTDPTLQRALPHVLAGTSCLYPAGLVLAVIGGGWAAFGRAPVIGIGLVLGGVGAVLVVVLALAQVLGPVAIEAPSLPDAMLPVLVAMAVGLVEQRRGVNVSTPRFNVAFATLLVGTFGIYAVQVALGGQREIWVGLANLLLVPVLLYMLLRVGPPALASLADPVGAAVLLALVSMAGVELTWRFLGLLSQDVHLHDTYFALVPAHATGGAALLLLLAACLHWSPVLFGREPRRFAALAGVLGFGGGMLTSVVAMAMLGQQGMPRRYYTYVPQFESLHQQVGLGGLVGAVGLLLVVLAIATGRRSSAG